MRDVAFIENKTDLKNSKISGKIYINNWSSAVETGICTGSGSLSDPYVIKDLLIDGGDTGVGVLIEDSKNYYFRIENCTIFNCETGIQFDHVNNGTLYRNNCSFNTNGIVVWAFDKKCENNTILENVVNNNNDDGISFWGNIDDGKIIGNTINNNDHGIILEFGSFNNCNICNNTVNENDFGIECNAFKSIISNNILYNNEHLAIAIEFHSRDTILTGNKMKGSGLSTLAQIKIDTSNLVNSKPLYYYKNKSNLRPEDFTNAGQIFLINCTNSKIENVDVSYSTYGIFLYYSNNITVINVNSSNNLQGVTLFNTNNSYIKGSTLNRNSDGIYLHYRSKNNAISDNYINNNSKGLYLTNSDNNTISNNLIDDNYVGISVFDSSNNKLRGNIIKNTWHIGVIFDAIESNNNSIFLNFFRVNGKHVRIFGNNTISWNNTEIGNYWDNYTGIDANGDGIGDSPHDIRLSPLIQDFLPIVDINPPEITILSPSNNSVFGIIGPNFEIEVNEKYLDMMWYTLDDGLHNYTFIENGTIDQTAWDEISNGELKLRFYATDKVGNIAFADVFIFKRSSSPNNFSMIIFVLIISAVGMISLGIFLFVRKRFKIKK